VKGGPAFATTPRALPALATARRALGAPDAVRADVLVVGAGVAGLTAALGCVPLRVVVLTKKPLSSGGAGGASVWAQGGVASAVGEDDDPALHAADTLAAGAGLNDARIVRLLTGEGPQRIRALLELGARFDRDAGGRLALGREAAHSRRRILHARGDATGAEVVRTLVEAVRREPAIHVVDETFAVDLALAGGAVVGLLARHRDGRRVLYRAPAVVLATGGLGQLFLYTTNPREATADGLAMAARAGARLVDLEFVQFHPTALASGRGGGGRAAASDPVAGEGGAVGAVAPLPLLTEALRGEGAVLVDERGVRFMSGVHPDRELAPRDVVARAVWGRLREGRRVFLDARDAVGERFPERFPTVFELCRQHGLDPRVEPMPVVPAAHYHMGGVAVDAGGRTSLPGLWACGEVAATGAHGANRLASNSLLEALVFGARVAEDITGSAGARRAAGARGSSRVETPPDLEATAGDAAALIAAVRRLMWELVGVERDEASLTAAAAELEALAQRYPEISGMPARPSLGLARRATPRHGRGPAAGSPRGRERSWACNGAAGDLDGWQAGEARNLLWAGRLLAQAALARRESRGGHYRTDYPQPAADWQRRLFLTAAADGTARFEGWEAPADRRAVAVAETEEALAAATGLAADAALRPKAALGAKAALGPQAALGAKAALGAQATLGEETACDAEAALTEAAEDITSARVAMGRRS
jgi:L-aspartate oxidase